MTRGKYSASSRGYGGRTPLMSAAMGAHSDILSLLLAHQDTPPVIDCQDDDGQTALHRSCVSDRDFFLFFS